MTTIGPYTLTGTAWDGEHAEVHLVTDTAGDTAVVKIAHGPDDEDHLVSEAMNLRTLRTDPKHERFLPYVPDIVTTFMEGDQRVNVFSYIDGLVSLSEVIAAYPGGVDHKDAAWMWRRILVALGFVHANGFIHGAVTPDHVLIHPTDHGVVLIDWGYAVPTEEKMIARSPSYRHWYPDPGIPLTPALDLHMACRTIAAVMGAGDRFAWPDFPPRPGDVEEQVWAHLKGCMMPDAPGAWDLKEDYDELLERLYGPRKYRPFSMPA